MLVGVAWSHKKRLWLLNLLGPNLDAFVGGMHASLSHRFVVIVLIFFWNI